MKVSITSDYELIARLNEHVHEVHSELYPKFFKQYDFEPIKEAFKNFITKENNFFLLIEDEDEAVGYAWIEIRQYPETPFTNSYRSIFIHNISINKTVRSHGYGSFLMEAIYQFARSIGIDLIQLDYWSDNQIAKNFYQKQGFKIYREFVFKEI